MPMFGEWSQRKLLKVRDTSLQLPQILSKLQAAPWLLQPGNITCTKCWGKTLPAAATTFQSLSNLQKEALGLNPEQFLSHASTPAIPVLSNMPQYQDNVVL